MKIPLTWHCYFIMYLFPLSVLSAQITNESFSSGSDGWTGTTAFGTGSWSFTGGSARVHFTDPGIALPDSATLNSAAVGSSGAFTGNFDQAGINLVGFSFFAPQIVPSGLLVLEWAGSTSLYQKGFAVTSTGVWHHFSASLADEAKGQWITLQGSIDDFAAARKAVDYISVRVTRNGVEAHDFMIDNVFLASQPDVGYFMESNDSTIALRWDSLQSNVLYFVESAPWVTGTWAAALSFTATNNMQWLSLTNSEPHQFWRMVVP